MKSNLKLQRVIAVITAFALMVSTLLLGSYSAFADGTPDIWDGSVSSGLTCERVGNEGKVDNPYLINNASDLAYLAKNAISAKTRDKYYKLTADIYINDVSTDWYATGNTDGLNLREWTYGGPEAGISGNGFCGTLDGDNHVIYGSYYEDMTTTSNYKAGLLFYGVNGKAVIKNLGMAKSLLKTQTTSGSGCEGGAFAGYRHDWNDGNGVVFENCFVDDTVYLQGKGVGGFVGVIKNATAVKIKIKNCYSAANLNGLQHNRAFIATTWGDGGNNSGITIQNSYSTSDCKSAFSSNGANLINCYSTKINTNVNTDNDVTVLTIAQMTGANAFTYMPALISDSAWQVMLNSTPKLRSFGYTADYVWNGNVADDFGIGGGTVNDPYMISTAEQLARLAKYAGDEATNEKYFKLTTDIYLNDTVYSDWYDASRSPREWTFGAASGDLSNKSFRGYLDGNGHTVYGLYIDGDYETAGLFKALSNKASIKNLAISNSRIKSTNAQSAVGAFAGKRYGWADPAANTVAIEGCYVDENVYITGYNVGGLIGYSADNYSASILNCYSKAQLTGSNSAYMLVGASATNNAVKINDSYAVGDKNLAPNSVVITNCYTNYADTTNTTATVLTLDQMMGPVSKKNITLDKEVWYVGGEGKTPQLRAFDDTLPPVERDPEVWNGTIATGFNGGNGSKNDPYQIATAEQLAYLASSINVKNEDDSYVANYSLTNGKYYKLTNDIYLNDFSSATWYEASNNPKEWTFGTQAVAHTNESSFAGTLDGDGHTIYGLYISGEYEVAGLFIGLNNNAKITNLGMSKAYINSTSSKGAVGAFAGKRHDWAGTGKKVTFDKCFVDETVIISGKDVGGFMGTASTAAPTEVISCYSMAKLTHFKNTEPVYMFLGAHWSNSAKNSVINSYAVGDADLVPSKATVTNCYTTYEDSVLEGVKVVSYENMMGEAAKVNIPLNEYVWYVGGEGKTPQLRVFDDTLPPVERDPRAWDGSKAESLRGNGTAAEPYLISNGAELFYLMTLSFGDTGGSAGNKYYKLTNDIYLNDIKYDDWYNYPDFLNAWTDGSTDANFSGSSDFGGVFDGDGHTIYGLYINGSYKKCGLFPKLDCKAQIKNLKISDSYIRNTYTGGDGGYAGAIAARRHTYLVNGAQKGVQFINCAVDSSVTIDAIRAGGLLGYVDGLQKTDFVNCYSNADLKSTLSSNSNLYAIVSGSGNLDSKVTLTNCYTSNNLPLAPSGAANTNCYTVYENSTEEGVNALLDLQMTGNYAEFFMKGLDFGRVWHMTDSTPDLTVFYKWDNSVADGYADGSGSESDPYLIENGEQLAKLASNLSATRGNYYKLTSDIYLNNVAVDGWTDSAVEWLSGTSNDANAGFAGHLDGDGHTVYGIYIKNNAKNFSGLFPSLLSGAEVTNLAVDYSYIKANEAAGAIAGVRTVNADGKVTIKQCITKGGVVLNAKYAGGLVGKVALKSGTVSADTEIDSVYSKASLQSTADGDKGAIVGYVADNDGGKLTIGGAYNIYPTVALAAGDQTKVKYSNCYTTGSAYADGITYLTLEQMKGDAAAENMDGLVFDDETGWYTVADGTPELSVFRFTEIDREAPTFKGKISVIATNETQAEFSWSKARDDKVDSALITYRIYVESDEITEDNLSTFTAKKAVSGFTTGSVSGLTKDETYYVAITAEDFYGNRTFLNGGTFVCGTNPTNNIWSGKESTIFGGGDGTEENPYIIANGEQLAKLVKNPYVNSYNGSNQLHYKLIADIYLNDVSESDWLDDFPREWIYGSVKSPTKEKDSFEGHLDGNGHVIHGIYIDENCDAFNGLFKSLSGQAHIENLGVADSYIKAAWKDPASTGNDFAGVIAGTSKWASGDGILLERCFADETVTLEATAYAGGLVCFVNEKTTMIDCYSSAYAEGSAKGGMSSTAWVPDPEKTGSILTLIRCFNTRINQTLVASNVNATFTDCYTLGPAEYDGITRPQPAANIRGEAARKSMPNLDYERTWMIVNPSNLIISGGAPVLRVFGENAYKYAGSRNPERLTVTLETNGGEALEPIYGYAGGKLVLPTPKRFGYTFAGWYVYKELDIEYPLDCFPEYSLTLYAKWIDSAVYRQNFESYVYTSYLVGGFGEDCEYFRPGTAGYDPTYVYAGSKSVHRKGETDDEQDILIYNDDEDIVPLEVGKAYTVQFMMNVETTSNKNGKLYLVCTDKFDVNEDPVAVQSFTTLDKFEKGQWYQVTVSFIAQAKYLAFRTPGSSSIYFDNVAIYKGDSAGGAGNTGNSSSIGNVTIEGIDEQTGESNMIYTWITVLACSAAAAVVMLIIKRKADKAA